MLTCQLPLFLVNIYLNVKGLATKNGNTNSQTREGGKNNVRTLLYWNKKPSNFRKSH